MRIRGSIRVGETAKEFCHHFAQLRREDPTFGQPVDHVVTECSLADPAEKDGRLVFCLGLEQGFADLQIGNTGKDDVLDSIDEQMAGTRRPADGANSDMSRRVLRGPANGGDLRLDLFVREIGHQDLKCPGSTRSSSSLPNFGSESLWCARSIVAPGSSRMSTSNKGVTTTNDFQSPGSFPKQCTLSTSSFASSESHAGRSSPRTWLPP